MTLPAITDDALEAAEAAGRDGYAIWRHDRDRDARPIRTIAVKAARAGAEAAAPHVVIAELRSLLTAHDTADDGLDLADRLAHRIAEIATSPRSSVSDGVVG